MRRVSLAKNEFYHIYNRGVDKRNIFLHKSDYQRFVDGLSVFNTKERIESHSFDAGSIVNDEDRLVNVLTYCLMPNHFHLMLEQKTENGIAKFIQKLITGYTMYFNTKNERSGVLLQGVFKSKHIATNAYLLELSRYIHANPVKLCGVNDQEIPVIRKFLLEYPWSSFAEYVKPDDRRPSIVGNKEMIMGQFSSPSDYVDFVLKLLPRRNLGKISLCDNDFLGFSEAKPRKRVIYVL